VEAWHPAALVYDADGHATGFAEATPVKGVTMSSIPKRHRVSSGEFSEAPPARRAAVVVPKGRPPGQAPLVRGA